MKVKTTLYLHGDKEHNYQEGKDLGITGEALYHFQHALYEVKFDLEVDTDTGETKIIKVDDKKLEE
ncbi:MAG TPA: hypothetical protein VMV86_02360 [Methanosarcinales archaeon]|nr:hypothetical protein [Methanosarcinales archaeon]